jgi:hypothetical protein
MPVKKVQVPLNRNSDAFMGSRMRAQKQNTADLSANKIERSSSVANIRQGKGHMMQ